MKENNVMTRELLLTVPCYDKVVNSNSFSKLVTTFGEMYDRNVKETRKKSRFSVSFSFGL